jgi:hypothetical protein
MPYSILNLPIYAVRPAIIELETSGASAGSLPVKVNV